MKTSIGTVACTNQPLSKGGWHCRPCNVSAFVASSTLLLASLTFFYIGVSHGFELAISFFSLVSIESFYFVIYIYLPYRNRGYDNKHSKKIEEEKSSTNTTVHSGTISYIIWSRAWQSPISGDPKVGTFYNSVYKLSIKRYNNNILLLLVYCISLWNIKLIHFIFFSLSFNITLHHLYKKTNEPFGILKIYRQNYQVDNVLRRFDNVMFHCVIL